MSSIDPTHSQSLPTVVPYLEPSVVRKLSTLATHVFGSCSKPSPDVSTLVLGLVWAQLNSIAIPNHLAGGRSRWERDREREREKEGR